MFVKTRVKTCLHDESGVATLELALFLSLLFLMIFGTYSLFDLFYNYNKSTKATQTVADMLSRQTEVTNSEISQLHNVYRSLAFTKPGDKSWIRITSVENVSADPDIQDLEIMWSHAEGDTSARDGRGSDFTNFVPELLPEEALVMVETYREATPVLNWNQTVIGGKRQFPNSLTVKPRWASSLKNLDFNESSGGSNSGGDDGDGGS